MSRQVHPEHRDQTAKSLEAAARQALTLSRGQNLTDSEWERACARLLEYARILGAWERHDKTNESSTDNVVRTQNRRANDLALDDAA